MILTSVTLYIVADTEGIFVAGLIKVLDTLDAEFLTEVRRYRESSSNKRRSNCPEGVNTILRPRKEYHVLSFCFFLHHILWYPKLLILSRSP